MKSYTNFSCSFQLTCRTGGQGLEPARGGQRAPLPAGLDVDGDGTATACLQWLHAERAAHNAAADQRCTVLPATSESRRLLLLGLGARDSLG